MPDSTIAIPRCWNGCSNSTDPKPDRGRAPPRSKLARQASPGHRHRSRRYSSGPGPASARTRPRRRRLLHPGWVPFAADGAGNHLAIDTAPGPNGVPGQVREFGADLRDGPFVHADSLVDFLARRRHPWPERLSIDHQVQPRKRWALAVKGVPAETQPLRLFELAEVTGTVVTRATNLKSLLRNVDRVDLAGLQGLPLQELSALDLERLDLASLAGHPTLRIVRLENVDQVDGVSALAELPAMESVTIQGPFPAEADLDASASPEPAPGTARPLWGWNSSSRSLTSWCPTVDLPPRRGPVKCSSAVRSRCRAGRAERVGGSVATPVAPPTRRWWPGRSQSARSRSPGVGCAGSPSATANRPGRARRW